ncbi:MAG: hypothetical protein E7A55_14905 [Clostridium perfringens]|nr:hypothetical protein [Clostridium perfringens]
MIARHTVTHIAIGDTDGRDAHGNPIGWWADPEVRKVFGWYQSSSSEPSEQGANRVSTTLVVLSPWPAAVKDRIVIDGIAYEVVGESQDWNHGPFGLEPGYQFTVRRIDG